MGIAFGIFVLTLLIVIHEFGHYIAARAVGAASPTFSVGMGPRMIGFNRWGTDWRFSWVPFGGYVDIDIKGLSVWQRVVIWSAGPLFSIFIPFLGLLVAIALFYPELSVIKGIKVYFTFLGNAVNFVFWWLVGFVTQPSESFSQLSGPVGMVNAVASNPTWFDAWFTACIVSASIGITNLIPIPPLDGGRLALLGVEAITRKPLTQKAEIILVVIGFGFVIVLLLVGLRNDISRFF